MTQQEALDILKIGHNVYLTGSAGSGKTYVLNQYINYLREHEIEVGITASTGIAATHMNGVTIHSWSGLGVRSSLSEEDIEAMEEKQYLWKRFENTKVLIIDEVSMLHHYRLDLIERICRSFKRNSLPFGGMQIVLCGDFFQLPPVSRSSEEPAHFIYHSEAWNAMNLKICYLEEQHRQKDKKFLNVLNAIRDNTVSEETYEHLESRFMKEPKHSVKPTKLYTHNFDVDAINEAELEKISGDIQTYTMKDKGKEFLVETLKKSCLAPQILRLKKGAQVMFVKNNYEAGYVNGTLGTVVDFSLDKSPIVETLTGKRIVANPIEWQIEEDGKVLAQIDQVPLRLAWAITVHKSQGMSLDAVEVDLSKSFEPGMGYVALSRVRSLDGLKLRGINDIALQVNPEVLEFDSELKDRSRSVALELNTFSAKEREELKKKFIERASPKIPKADKLPTHKVTLQLLNERKTLKQIAQERNLTVETIIDHLEKAYKEADESLDLEFVKDNSMSPTRLKKIENAFKVSFKKTGDSRLAPVKTILGKGFTYEEIRLARLLLGDEL